MIPFSAIAYGRFFKFGCVYWIWAKTGNAFGNVGPNIAGNSYAPRANVKTIKKLLAMVWAHNGNVTLKRSAIYQHPN